MQQVLAHLDRAIGRVDDLAQPRVAAGFATCLLGIRKQQLSMPPHQTEQMAEVMGSETWVQQHANREELSKPLRKPYFVENERQFLPG